MCNVVCGKSVPIPTLPSECILRLMFASVMNLIELPVWKVNGSLALSVVGDFT